MSVKVSEVIENQVKQSREADKTIDMVWLVKVGHEVKKKPSKLTKSRYRDVHRTQAVISARKRLRYAFK